MLLFNPLKDGLSPEALEQCYNILLSQKLIKDAKLERIKKELAVAACTIDDGTLTDLEQAKNGMLNLIAYIEANATMDQEFKTMAGSLEIVNDHLKRLKEYATKKANS